MADVTLRGQILKSFGLPDVQFRSTPWTRNAKGDFVIVFNVDDAPSAALSQQSAAALANALVGIGDDRLVASIRASVKEAKRLQGIVGD